MQSPRSQRDPRLDFFRGMAMLIIYIAHVPWNYWANWIPARFGFSDGGEMFVFCSGFAVAIAFGGTFMRAGFGYGVLRIVARIWQLYAAHIGMLIFIATLLVLGNTLFEEPDYVQKLNLKYLFNHTEEALLGYFTLTYVPNFFDILPIYIVALALVPVVMALGSIHRWLAIGFCLALYVGNWVFGWNFPAEPWSDREWFFNPMGWQLVFFTGFFISIGWVPLPPVNRTLIWVAAIFVIAVIPMAHWPIWSKVALAGELHAMVKPFIAKTDYGILRIVHFLALAYLAVSLVNRHRWIFDTLPARLLILVGQHSLAVFLFSMWLARASGMVLDQIGRNWTTVSLVNIAGLTIVISFAAVARILKRRPWREAAKRPRATGQRDSGQRDSGQRESETADKVVPVPSPAE